MSESSPKYLDIHSKNKRDLLFEKMQTVASQIHARFPRGEAVSSCPCCLSSSISAYVERFGFPMDICLNCGHIFTNPFPTPDALNYYYNSDFKDFENSFFIETFEKRIPIFEDRLRLIIGLAAGDQLLDVGSAVGIFVAANERAGGSLDITACDISASACAMLSARFPDLNVIHSDVLALDVGQYDVVTLWDTFEHIPDPTRLLDAIKRQLRTGGYFVFSTPNTKGYEWEVMQQNHVQLLPPGHVNLYNTENISDLLERNGYEVVDIRTMNPLLDLTYVRHAIEKQVDSSGICLRAATKLIDFILTDEKLAAVEESMRKKLMAGNMVVVARPYE